MADALTERIIGAAIEVHRELGPGLLESIYEEALCHEFELQAINYQRQVPVQIIYKSRDIKGFKLYLLVEGEVVVELKAVELPPKLALSQRHNGRWSYDRLAAGVDLRIIRLGSSQSFHVFF